MTTKKELPEIFESIEKWDIAESHNKIMEEAKQQKEFKEKEQDKQRLKFIKSKVDFLVDKQNYREATEILVEEVLKVFKIYTTRDDKSSEVWVYSDGIYVPQGKSLIKELIRNIIKDSYNIWLVNQVIAKIEADTQIDPQTFFDTNYKYEVPVKNGILNIETRELSEFTRDKIFFNKLNANYSPEANCPQIDKFLEEILLTADDKNVFYEIGGFTLLKEYKFEKAFMFVGNGRNGKDKSLELIKRLLGIENVCSVPLSALKPESFIISEFFGKMANIAGEISNQDLKDSSEFKALTGRSLRSAPRKFLKPISFVNYAKFIFACNDLPMVYDTSAGFWNRWVLLEFPYTFVTQQELDLAKDKTNLKLRDEDIINKITTEDEMSGLLNKFLEGFDRLNETRNFSTARGSDEVKNLWIRKSNSVMAFCFKEIQEEYDGLISKKEFRKKYFDFCKEFKVSAKSDYVIKRTLEEMYGVSETRKEVFGGNWEYFWEGIKWKN